MSDTKTPENHTPETPGETDAAAPPADFAGVARSQPPAPDGPIDIDMLAAEAADADAVSGEAPASEAAARPRPADAVKSAIMGMLPADMAPYLSLSRVDRPAGFWLLALPCFIGLAFARLDEGWRWIDPVWLILFGIGAIAMRGAGCTWNDIQDRDIDASVARTAGRPIPSGQVTLPQAWMWLGMQLVVGFLVWACLPLDAKIVAALAIPLVAAYPFMKRITWWPQAWLGMTFNWGVLVAAATAGDVTLLSVILFIGLAFWTIGYDTIYAVSDREDDALIGVRSTARLFKDRTGLAVFCFYLAAATIVALAAWIAGAGRIGAITVLAFLAHGTWQVFRLKRSGEAAALPIFRSNVVAGAIVFIGLALAAFLAYDRRAPQADPRTPAAITAPNADTAPTPRVYNPLSGRLGRDQVEPAPPATATPERWNILPPPPADAPQPQPFPQAPRRDPAQPADTGTDTPPEPADRSLFDRFFRPGNADEADSTAPRSDPGNDGGE